MREGDLNKKSDTPGPEERALKIQKRLEELEEQMKGFGGWIKLPEKEKEQWKKSTRAGLELKYEETSGLLSESDDEVRDDEDVQAIKYRDHWTFVWGHLGSFEDTTTIPAMRFTYDPSPPPHHASPSTTIQVFSAKMAGLSGCLQFPLDVYGVIAARDCADRRRNIIFSRTRNNCQTITEQDPYFVLTGPSRAIVLVDPVFIEVMLKVKGVVESEDKMLQFQTTELVRSDTGYSRVINESYTRKLSTLELTLGSVAFSVEVFISVRVVDVSLPDVFVVTAHTNNSNPSSWGAGLAAIDSKKIILLDSRHTSEPVSREGYINLSRSVVSARITGNLIVCIEALIENSKENMVLKKVVFPARKEGRCNTRHRSGCGTIEIAVAWSLVSHN